MFCTIGHFAFLVASAAATTVGASVEDNRHASCEVGSLDPNFEPNDTTAAEPGDAATSTGHVHRPR